MKNINPTYISPYRVLPVLQDPHHVINSIVIVIVVVEEVTRPVKLRARRRPRQAVIVLDHARSNGGDIWVEEGILCVHVGLGTVCLLEVVTTAERHDHQATAEDDDEEKEKGAHYQPDDQPEVALCSARLNSRAWDNGLWC